MAIYAWLAVTGYLEERMARLTAKPAMAMLGAQAGWAALIVVKLKRDCNNDWADRLLGMQLQGTRAEKLNRIAIAPHQTVKCKQTRAMVLGASL
jgi:hypothetical protein